MAKNYSEFICQQCGFKSPSFYGKCPGCGEWNSLVESVPDSISNLKSQISNLKFEDSLVKLSEVKSQQIARLPSGYLEFDRVLGGGIVPGSIVLISGDPGIGKSTLLLQTAMRMAEGERRQRVKEPKEPAGKFPAPKTSDSSFGSCVLYVTGEESGQQVKIRADRMVGANSQVTRSLGNRVTGLSGRLKTKIPENLFILPQTDVDVIVAATEKLKPSILIVDSIQTLTTSRLTGSAGSVGQVRECSQVLQAYAKKSHTPIFIVGHVTKEGNIAGPKVLEHLVDAVLNLEGDGMHSFRILRSTKNRFGSTFEVGVFEMTDGGMAEVSNPSQIFLSQHIGSRAGSVVASTITGERPIMAEIQALCTSTIFGIPIRRATGLDFSRVQIVIAALTKAANLTLGNLDIYVNVAGGLKIIEPAADLPVALSIVSAALNKPIRNNLCVFGEVGLLGELRPVNRAKNRMEEAKRLGFSDFVHPERFKTLEEAIGYAIHEG